MSPPEATLVVQFVIQNGTLANQKATVSDVLAGRPVFIIGSDLRCHLQLPDPTVAPAHAVVSLKQGEYFIQPQFPKNEVLVNGKRIEGLTRLTSGDTVQVGDTLLGFGQEMVVGRPTPVVAPVVKPFQTRAVVPAPQSRITYPAGSAARRTLAPVAAGQAPVVYYPKPESAGGLNFGVLLIAFVIIAAAAGIGGYALSGGNLLSTASVSNSSGFAIQDGTVLIVMFDADWWQYCKQQIPIVNGLDQEYGDKVEVRYVNVDDPGNRRLVSRYGARTIPHIVILNDSGGVTSTFVGVTQKDVLRKAIERALLESPLDAG